MSNRLPPICLLDPLTLLGRELLQLLGERDDRAPDIAYFHTRDEDEHDVAELAGDAGLVPPLTSIDDVPAASVVVLTAVPEAGRAELVAALLDPAADTAVLDLTGTVPFRSTATLAEAPLEAPRPARVRVASPGTCAVHHVATGLRSAGIRGVTGIVELPASAAGFDRVEQVAIQAAARLQGETPEPLADDTVQPFNLIADVSTSLAHELDDLLPWCQTAVRTVRSGAFHGFAAHLGLVFDDPVEAEQLVALVDDDPRLEIADRSAQLTDMVEVNTVVVMPPTLSADGRLATTTALFDGARVGGAHTALEILPTLI